MPGTKEFEESAVRTYNGTESEPKSRAGGRSREKTNSATYGKGDATSTAHTSCPNISDLRT